ncbi:MAG TPA: chromate transporter, partial [Thauera sp.]|nr:chromate transporter [Thauera sp.]
TGWLLALPFVGDPAHRNGALVLIALTALVTLRTKLAPIWMIAAGAVLGAAGLA